MDRRISLLSLGLLGAFVACSVAADWPQWRGPRHDGTSTETGLLKQWPAEGPKMLWKNDTIGGGYSTPSVVGKHVYLLGDKDKEEYLIVLDAATGKEVLRFKVGPVGKDGPPSYPGPRSTPTIDGDAIYVLGSAGDLVCFSMKGDVKWKKNLKSDFAGKVGQWAYAESPLVDGGVVVCTPGGEKSTLVALDKKTGATIWESAVPGGDAAGYASVLPIEVGGVRQYVQFLAKGLVGVDAKTGKFLWRYAGTIDQAANIPTPVFHDNCVFTSTSRKGTGLNRIQVKDGAVTSEEVYFVNTKINSIGGVVLVGDHVYGANDKGELVCMEFKTGDVKWRDPSVGTASVCYADGMLYVRGQGGSGFGPESPAKIALVEASPDGYKEHGRFEQPNHADRPAWPHPVVANGCLYLRDQGVLFCYDVRAAK
jgi:outer membrane protein assembly factor BamB